MILQRGYLTSIPLRSPVICLIDSTLRVSYAVSKLKPCSIECFSLTIFSPGMASLKLLDSLIKVLESVPNSNVNDNEDEMKQRVGGFNDSAVDEMVIAAANAVKQQVIEKANFAQIKVYIPISAKKQVVAGINYCIKVKVDVNSFIHINVYGRLDRSYELKGICFDKSLNDPLDFSLDDRPNQIDRKQIANSFVGKVFYKNEASGDDANGVYQSDVDAIAALYRAVHPPAMMTMDYNENRLNIFMEKGTNKIQRVTWG